MSDRKQASHRRKRIGYGLFIATAYHPPTQLQKANRVRDVLTNLGGFLVTSAINLYYEFPVHQGKVSDVSKPKERMLTTVPLA